VTDIQRTRPYAPAFPSRISLLPPVVESVGAGRSVGMAMKRLMDAVAALIGLVVLGPLMLVIAAVVRLESPGPALFRQVRLGKNSSPFEFYKFRTMVDGNDPDIHKRYVEQLITRPSAELKGDGGAFKIERDPRVTRFGALLRRSSLDELPQLINVLRGDMSLVGPRPPLPYEVELYSDRARRRLECEPGITGLWQVSGRCLTTFDEMVELDIKYIDNWTLGLDLWILIRTLPAVLSEKGAW
jgi:lipopolysaccharide/colanic/teichoic acid biosynthesis glycosyltransferase